MCGSFAVRNTAGDRLFLPLVTRVNLCPAVLENFVVGMGLAYSCDDKKPWGQKQKEERKMMNKKVTAMVLASVLASPIMMAKISMADGGGLEFEKGFCLPAPAPGTRCPATSTKGAAEVEYLQRLRNGFTRTKLSAEVEFKVPAVSGAPGTLPTDADITIEPIIPPVAPATFPTFGTPIMCTFVNPPTVKDILSKAIPPATPVLLATKVAFHGSLSQSTDPAAVLPPNTLDCGVAPIPTLLKGSKVTVGVNGADVVIGTLKLDD